MKTKLKGKLMLVFLTAILLVLFAQGMAAWAAEGEAVTVAEVVYVNIPDPNLETAVRTALNKPEGGITSEDMATIINLIAMGKGIKNLSGLEYGINIRLLALDNNQISDLTPLAGLNNLQTILLGFNNISDISPLANLTNLNYHLKLSYNPISDYSPLTNLTNLFKLTLDYNSNYLKDFSFLNSMTALRDLSLADNNISDLSILANLNLTSLNLFYNKINDISPLANLTNLSWLNLIHNRINDLTPLANLTNLQNLRLEYNFITDISPLVANPGINLFDYVTLQYNYLDLTPGSPDDTDIQTLLNRRVSLSYSPQNPQDTTPPSVLSADPANNATGVPVDTKITISFNEYIKPGPNINGITITTDKEPVEFTYTYDYSQLFIQPLIPLNNGDTYTVYIPQGAVTDGVGNPLAGEYTFSFTTIKSNDKIK